MNIVIGSFGIFGFVLFTICSFIDDRENNRYHIRTAGVFLIAAAICFK